MSASTKGFTIIELLVAIVVGSLLIGTMLTVTFLFYGGTIRENYESRLAVESGNLLRSITDELRTSSGVRSANAIADPNAPGGQWTTSNASLVLIISTPVIDSGGNFVMSPLTGAPYQNEIVYFAQGGTLYKRYLANP
ncbi:MAG TPA: type II secretion system protein, partial [Candidatus Saccharimonadales bacterium]|nr:type II secretion system protein [Candidatus Saccharimonadales bacterium]